MWNNHHTFQQSHFWKSNQNNWEQDLKEIHAHPCSLQQYSQQLWGGSNANVRRCLKGWTKRWLPQIQNARGRKCFRLGRFLDFEITACRLYSLNILKLKSEIQMLQNLKCFLFVFFSCTVPNLKFWMSHMCSKSFRFLEYFGFPDWGCPSCIYTP